MYLPPEDRRPGYPFQPEEGMSRRAEAILLCLIVIFLLAALLAPIGGATIMEALLALMH